MTLAACNATQFGVNNSDENGESCAGQAMNDQFLVKWKTAVPDEYQAFRLSPNSLVTRFKETTRSVVEQEVLAKHLGEYDVAEFEFRSEPIENAEEVQTSERSFNAATNGTWGPADIEVQQAWNYLGKEGDGIIVGVVDSGVDVNHPLIQSALWVNTGEIPNNGVDDDHDGYIDDVNGFDFNGNTGAVTDAANHGTHVSGIIAGQADPGGSGFTGVAPNAKILAAKFIDGSGSGAIGDAITGIDYAVDHGARVINASWGGADCSSILEQNIATATNAGVVFVNAAGNNDQNISQYPEWPAAFQVPGKITVASYNSSEFLSTFSNYGILVDLAAPGENILSTVPPGVGQPEGQLGIKSGTSMATPFVSGVAALLLSAKPSATAVEIANAINNSVTPMNYGVRTGGKINALSAAEYLMTH